MGVNPGRGGRPHDRSGGGGRRRHLGGGLGSRRGGGGGLRLRCRRRGRGRRRGGRRGRLRGGRLGRRGGGPRHPRADPPHQARVLDPRVHRGRLLRRRALAPEEVQHEQRQAGDGHHEGDDEPALRRVQGDVQGGVLLSATGSGHGRRPPNAPREGSHSSFTPPGAVMQARAAATQPQLSTRRRDRTPWSGAIDPPWRSTGTLDQRSSRGRGFRVRPGWSSKGPPGRPGGGAPVAQPGRR